MIKIIDGDLFSTSAEIIALQVNCQGKMGSGVALQVKEKYPLVYDQYKKVCSHEMLGKIQIIGITNKRFICNLFSQNTYGYDGAQYTSLEALEQCFVALAKCAIGRTVAMPYKIGCVRGGADWLEVYLMIKRIFVNENVELWRYDKG